VINSWPLSNLVPRPRLHAIKFVTGRQKHVPCSPFPSTGTLTLGPPATMTGGEQHNLTLLPGR